MTGQQIGTAALALPPALDLEDMLGISSLRFMLTQEAYYRMPEEQDHIGVPVLARFTFARPVLIANPINARGQAESGMKDHNYTSDFLLEGMELPLWLEPKATVHEGWLDFIVLGEYGEVTIHEILQFAEYVLGVLKARELEVGFANYRSGLFYPEEG